MTFNRDFLTSATGQVVLVAAVLIVGVVTVRWPRTPPALPTPVPSKPAPSVPLPRVLTREVARFVLPTPAPIPVNPGAGAVVRPAVAAPRPLPLLVIEEPKTPPAEAAGLSAPYGRLIPCETVVALESSRLQTPLIGLVTEDVWHDGRLIVPAGAEVHGPTALDQARERLAAQGSWKIVWRTRDAENGREITAQGIALDREYDARTGIWGEPDGSAGLRGQVVKTQDERELKLFAATFLSTATSALQQFQPAAGLLGEAALPVATAHNAVLAGTGAILREYAQELRETIARDGFYLRVPAGKPFYLYLTETLNRGERRRSDASATASSHR
jgi:hypothetical protein